MRIDEILAAWAAERAGAGAARHGGGRPGANAEPVFSFELFPPKTAEGEHNLRGALAQLSQLHPAFVSVTYGAGGSTRERTIEIVKAIKREYGLEAMAHLTCVGASAAQLRETVAEMADAGIENILALRGDAPRGDSGWQPAPGGLEHAAELIELVHGEADMALGGACFPETHPEAADAATDVAHLAEKVRAGASFLITQLFFDNACYFDFVRRARAAGITVPIVPGVMPITQAGQVQRMAEMSHASIPEQLSAELAARGADEEGVLELGVAYATLQCAELLAAGAPGIHFYTLNRSPATRAILTALRLAKPWQGTAGAIDGGGQGVLGATSASGVSLAG